jgi:hypothetical protein
MQVAVGLHLAPTKDTHVQKVIEEVSNTNRDPHLLFDQVGQKAGLIPANIVSSAFISLWMTGNPNEVEKIVEFIRKNLNDFDSASKT